MFHMSELNFPAKNSNNTSSFPQSLAWPIVSQRSETYKPTESELPDNGGEDDPQCPHSDGTYNTYSPKCAP